MIVKFFAILGAFVAAALINEIIPIDSPIFSMALLGICLFVALYLLKKYYKPKKKTNMPEYVFKRIAVHDQNYAQEFYEFYKDRFEESEEFKLSDKELMERWNMGRIDGLVQKYIEEDIEFTLIGKNVCTTLDGNRVVVGTVADEDIDLIKANPSHLKLEQGTYKAVFDDEVTLHEGSPMFYILVVIKQ